MIMRGFIADLYKVMYNRKSRRGNSATVACLFTALFFCVFILDFLVLIEISFHTRIYTSNVKIISVICFGFITLMMYQLLFKVLKIEQAGEDGYELEDGVSRKIWMTYCLNLAFMFILPLIRTYVFGI